MRLGFKQALSSLRSLSRLKSFCLGKFPAGVSLEQVLAECIDVFLEKKCPVRRDKRRKARASKIDKSKPTVSKPKIEISRNIPAAIRDEVYVRDGGKMYV